MKFLIDTDHISILQRQAGPEFARLSLQIENHSSLDIAYCIVSFHEQVMGCNNYINQSRDRLGVIRGYLMLDRMLKSYSSTPVLRFDEDAFAIFESLVAQRIRIGTMDLRIAAIAISKRLTLLTRNISDFGQIPGLKTENWTV